jgi:tripartite ATP-independent transporter DctM subunit
VITVAFLLVLIVLTAFFALTGAGPTGPIGGLLLLCAVFVVFFCAGIYVAAALGTLGIAAGFVFSPRPLHLFVGQATWIPSINFVLVAVPLFLLMGEILLRAGLSERLYRALNLWFGRLPGGILHTNIISCAIFSAIAGSSVATAATIGSVALPYFERTRYSQRMVLGSLAAGGALGNLIPPGITFIVYGLLTETSVGKMYMAAFIPGFMVAGLFMLVILVYSVVGVRADAPLADPVGWRERIRSLRDLVPTLVLILVVLGTIYAGVATPTEAAALGVVGAIVFAAVERRLTLRVLHASAEATARTTSLIGLIILGGFVLNYALSSLRLPQALAEMVKSLALPSWAIMLIIIGFYLALGTFMEGFSMIITTLPVVFPIVLALGYDPIWFGVIITMLIEIAMISPPDGTVMYVLQGMRLTPGPITDVFVGVTPFVLVYLLGVGILMVYPDIALWLPRMLQ